MSDDEKMKLPAELVGSGGQSPVSEKLQTEMLKNERAGIDAYGKVEVARLQVMKEAISVGKALLDVLKSHNELQATRAEWTGRVDAAESSLRKAEVDLEATKEQNKPRMEALEQSKEGQKRLLALFDNIMDDLSMGNLSEDTKADTRQHLLQLSDLIVKLRQ